ncbi:YidC/Oxa1 family membrane protein insertase [Candidatus Saccharibacteria bacterium]|nr:YidC/Oxa1 family membrane protein insertase [Candidatus Saccharibacteria bacterium]
MFWLIDTVIVRPIVNILFLIYNLVGDFGLAIILFTIIVKFCMWPLVKRQLHQTKLMRKIQPELAEIRKRCNGNKQMESIQMLDLYKRNNIKPFRSVLTLFIQLPIFLSLFMAISAMVNPRPNAGTCGYTNISNCVYEPIKNLDRIHDLSVKQDEYLAKKTGGEEATYDFHPQLFGQVNLDTTASAVFAGTLNISTICVFLFAVGAAVMQYFMAKQTSPNSGKKKSFRQLMKEAESGKEPDQAELNAIASQQMTFMMPVMMFLIMFNLPGALVFYYLITNLITYFQQKIVLSKVDDELDDTADRAILKELKKVKEAEVIENKKTGTKITRISAKDDRKRNKH